MPCFSPCDYKKEVSLLKKELAALDPVRVKEKLAEAERCILRVTGERDRARTRNKELQKHIESLKYTNQSLNDRLEWTKEDLQKEVKEGKDAQKALKRKGLVNKRVGLIRSASGLAASRPLRYASTCMYWYCISWKTDSWTAPVCF